MLKLDREIQIYFAVHPINMLNSFDGLASLVVDVIQENPLSQNSLSVRFRPFGLQTPLLTAATTGKLISFRTSGC
ncbi:MAG: hypothetical protein OEX19_14235 [Gammaproteobacteria bacterium]|nr:hypothetical protein [Gammaproteobacteria bacterium]